jgi:hypothetical protein
MMDMFLIPLLTFAFITLMLAYEAGKFVTVNPTEDEMLEMLVQIRVERKLESISKDSLEQDIEERAVGRLGQ